MKSPSRSFFVRLMLWLGFTIVFSLAARAKPELQIRRHAPWNLFNTTEDVRFEGYLRGIPPGKTAISAVLVDETGHTLVERSMTPTAGAADAPALFTVDMGRPGRGYYELRLTISVKGADGHAASLTSSCSLGVMEFAQRTAKEARDGGYIFGLKWWGGIQNLREMEDGMCKLGLQWTRIIQNEGGKGPDRLTSAQILGEYPMNAVVKVERFPRECYDAERYGPIDEWEKKYGRGSWSLKSLPAKEPYQKWLREQIAALPPEQQIFEVWNEPWDKLSPEDCATLGQWIVEAITKDRPNAIIGPNLYGNTSAYEYDAKFIQAGGMKGMKMVALHPYAISENRAWLRDYRDWLKSQLGRSVEICITEYGSHSTPEGPARRSEMEQSRRVVRQSLALYSEGVSALIPHWAGQTEHNPTYIEDWFGFVRKNEQPKPVLIAHANCARLVDGSRYVGDLWFGPRVEAMLFDKNGVRTLALWTLAETPSPDETVRPTRDITLRPGSDRVTLVDILGRETPLQAANGEIKLTLTDSPVYLVGVGSSLDSQASLELRPDRWPKPEKLPRTERKAVHLEKPPVTDGDFSDWPGAQQVALLNPRVAGEDCSAMACLGWDEHYLYVGVNVRDNELLNTQARKYLYREDCVELFVSTEPRDSGSGFGPHDFQFMLAPTSGEGNPIIGIVTDREAGVVEDVQGAKFFAGKKPAGGWALEVALPWSVLGGYAPKPGSRLALDFMLSDADTSHKRFKIPPSDAAGGLSVSNPSSWALLDLE